MVAQPTPPRNAADIFREVCILGEGKFVPGAIVEIDYRKLPREMRTQLEFPLIPVAGRRGQQVVRTSGQYFEIVEGDTKAFLAVEERGAEGRSEKGRYCSLATRSIDLQAAVSSLDAEATVDTKLRSNGPITSRGVGWTVHSSAGYRLMVNKLNRGFVLLQSVYTGEDEPARLLERLRPSADDASKAKIDELLNSQKEPE